MLSCIVLCLCSCTAPHRATQQPQVISPAELSADQEAQARAQHQAIVQLTDRVLQALTVRHYDRLQQFLEPTEPQLSGRNVARRLLGSRFDTLILDRWDARQIEVTFEPGLTQATAHILIHYRPAPNRKPRTTTFVLRCRRDGPGSPWLLDLQ